MISGISQLDNGKVEISTTRLLIRGARHGDGVALYEAFRDPEVMRYWYFIIRQQNPACSLDQGVLFHTLQKRNRMNGSRKWSRALRTA